MKKNAHTPVFNAAYCGLQADGKLPQVDGRSATPAEILSDMTLLEEFRRGMEALLGREVMQAQEDPAVQALFQ